MWHVSMGTYRYVRSLIPHQKRGNTFLLCPLLLVKFIITSDLWNLTNCSRKQIYQDRSSLSEILLIKILFCKCDIPFITTFYIFYQTQA